MRKYLSLLMVAALAACDGSETGGGQTASSISGSGSDSSSSGTSSSGAGGSGQGGAGGAGGASITEVPGEASVINDCAPDDGKAYTIKIGLPERTCFSVPSGAFLRMSFYTHVDSPAGNSWSLLNAAGEAQGIYQPDAGDPSNLVVVNIGTLQVNTWDAFSATGSYDVVLIDGTHLVGLFDAIACLQDQPLCG